MRSRRRRRRRRRRRVNVSRALEFITPPASSLLSPASSSVSCLDVEFPASRARPKNAPSIRQARISEPAHLAPIPFLGRMLWLALDTPGRRRL